MLRSLLLVNALACGGAPRMSGPECPGLDCIDSLTLTVLDPSGARVERFGGWASVADGAEIAFSCGDTPVTDAGARCLGEGRVELVLYGDTVTLHVDQGDGGATFDGSVEPVWEAPYDSEECGHYCYLSEATVTLAP
jgi:hypothetical protein